MSALHGVHLVSLALNVPGPVAVARLLAEGATAVKVEPPSGDPLAEYSRAWYDALHTGVRVVTLDLKSEDGRRALASHLTKADVLITSHRPAALARLGLGAAATSARLPHLRRVSVVGQVDAPDRAGHDVTYQAEAGLLHDRLPPTLLADMTGAERVVSAVLLVLREGPGAHRVVGLRDVVDDVAAPRRYGLTAADGRFGGAEPAYQVYAARDGHVAVAALEPQFRQRLAATLGVPLDVSLAGAFAMRACEEWTALAAAHDLPIAACAPASTTRR